MNTSCLHANPHTRLGAAPARKAPAAAPSGRRHGSPELQRQAEIAYAAALEVLG